MCNFHTKSNTFHGHPHEINRPANISRKSIALNYFSFGRPDNEGQNKYSTIFRPVKNEVFKKIIKK